MSDQKPSTTSSSHETCPACLGKGYQGVGFQRALGGATEPVSKAECGACGGSGKKGDRLSKVAGQPEFDLRK